MTLSSWDRREMARIRTLLRQADKQVQFALEEGRDINDLYWRARFARQDIEDVQRRMFNAQRRWEKRKSEAGTS